MEPILYTKMNGLGNDFVILDARHKPFALNDESIVAIADRQNGIGCDQLIVLETSAQADVFMRIYNADGSQVDACGNATRCVGWLMAQEKDLSNIRIETNAGLLHAVTGEGTMVAVDMGEPKFGWEDIPLSEEFNDTRFVELQVGPIDDPILHTPSVVNVGNPHCIFFVDNLDDHDLSTVGPFLENHMLFPERANISLAQVDGNTVYLNVWERGAGLTKACGTAACAAGVCAARRSLTGRNVTVVLPGGPLYIEWRDDNHIVMTGETELEEQNLIDPESFGFTS